MDKQTVAFLLGKYIDKHHISLVDFRQLKEVLETADDKTASVIIRLMNSKPNNKEK